MTSIERSKEADVSAIEKQRLLKNIISRIEAKFGKLPPDIVKKLATLPIDALKDVTKIVDSYSLLLEEHINKSASGKIQAAFGDPINITKTT